MKLPTFCQLKLAKNEKVALGATFFVMLVGAHAPIFSLYK